MQPGYDSRGVARPLSALLRLAMLGCPARRARGQLAAGACAPEPVWDRCGSSSAGACAWLRGCSAGAWGVCWRVCARLPLARLRGSAPRRRFRKVIGGTNRGIPKNGAPEPSSPSCSAWGRVRSRTMVRFWRCGPPRPVALAAASITGFPFFGAGGRAHARGAHGAGSAPGRRRVSWRAGRCRGAPGPTELSAPRPAFWTALVWPGAACRLHAAMGAPA